MLETFITLLLIILFAFLFYKWFTVFFDCRFEKYASVSIIIYSLACILLRLIVNHFLGKDGIDSNAISSIIELFVFDLLFIVIVFKGKFFEKLFVFILTTMLLPAIFTLAVGLLNHALNLPNNAQIYENNTYINFFTVHILSYVAILITEERIRKKRYETKNFFVSIIFWVIIFQFLMHYYFSYMTTITEDTTEYRNLQLIYAFSIIIFFCICVMYEKSITMFNHTLQMRHQLEYYNLQAKLYEDSTKNLIQHRKLRHDYKNHLITIQGLLESKEFEQADAYISDLLITPGEVTKIIDNRNPTLSAILTYKNRECQEKGIAFQYRLDYDEIHIDPVDLTILIGNLLDNAIEACMKLEEGAEKKIRFSLTTEKSALAILCANPYHEPPKQKGKRFLTSKNDPLNHGLGLGNVEDVLSKYDGSKKVDPENGMFLISLILNNE